MTELPNFAKTGNLDGVKKALRGFLFFRPVVDLPDDWGHTPLYLAAQYGHTEVVSYLIKRGADVNCADKQGFCPLHAATSNAMEAVVELLLKNGANASAQSTKGVTPLILAMKLGRSNIVHCLLAYGATPDSRNNDGCRPLDLASEIGDNLIVSLLLEKGADANATDNRGFGAIDFAVEKGNESVVALLIEKGADVKRCRPDKYTMLHTAAFKNYPAIAALLIKGGAVVDAKCSVESAKGWTPLMIAAANGHVDILTMLLDAGADVSVRDNQGYSAHDIAKRASRWQLADYLKNKMNEQEERRKSNQVSGTTSSASNIRDIVWSVIHPLNTTLEDPNKIIALGPDCIPVVADVFLHPKEPSTGTACNQAILANVLDVFARKGNQDAAAFLRRVAINEVELFDVDGQTAFEIAKRFVQDISKEHASVEPYIESMASPEPLPEVSPSYTFDNAIADVQETITLNQSAKFPDLSSYALLNMLVTIRDGADINTMKGVTTALMLAAETRHDLVARLLIKSGATVNANTETDHGMEMLANAVNGGIEWLVCLLIDKGADVNVRIDKDNNTVLMHAIRSLHDTSSVVQLILEKGAEVDAMNNWGHTALWIAASMIHGGTNDAEINSSNYSALWAAADMTRARNARLLIENGANVNTKANNGWTPLMWAARGGIDWLVRLLIEKGADINARNNDGDTALMWAELEGHKHVVRLLKGHAD